MRLWEFGGGKTIQWRAKVSELCTFRGNWNLPVLLPVLPLPYQGLTSVPASSFLVTRVQGRMPPPFTSLPVRKTEQGPLLPWPRTHTQHFPLLRVLASADSLKPEEGGREDTAHHPPSLPPCFWELSSDTPCRHLLCFHPQSCLAQSRGALEGGGPWRRPVVPEQMGRWADGWAAIDPHEAV